MDAYDTEKCFDAWQETPADHQWSVEEQFERLVSICLWHFMERVYLLLNNKFAYLKGLGICDALLCFPYTVKCVGESTEARIVQNYFGVAFDIGSTIWEFSVCSALWVLEVLCCLYLHSLYQINHRTLWWTVVRGNWITFYQESHIHGSVLCLLLFLMYTLDLSSILENKLISYADDSTLIAVVPPQGDQIPVWYFKILMFYNLHIKKHYFIRSQFAIKY